MIRILLSSQNERLFWVSFSFYFCQMFQKCWQFLIERRRETAIFMCYIWPASIFCCFQGRYKALRLYRFVVLYILPLCHPTHSENVVPPKKHGRYDAISLPRVLFLLSILYRRQRLWSTLTNGFSSQRNPYFFLHNSLLDLIAFKLMGNYFSPTRRTNWFPI